MKKIVFLIFILLTFESTTYAQTFILLDRHWGKKAILTDSVTRENLSNGWYPIYKDELDSLITRVDKLRNLKDDGLHRKFYYSEDFKTDHLEFVIENIKRVYGDGYEINLISTNPQGKTIIKLSDPRLLLTDNQKVIRTFLGYLKKTKKDIGKSTKNKR